MQHPKMVMSPGENEMIRGVCLHMAGAVGIRSPPILWEDSVITLERE